LKKFWNWVKNEEGRTLYFDGYIAADSWYDDDITPQKFKAELNASVGNISVWLNSPGGDVFAGNQIYNMLKEYKGKVTVKIDALAASAASVIAMAGDEIVMSPVSMLMIHNPATMIFGEAADFQSGIKMLGEAEIVERIFNDYVSGKGTFVIAKELNAEGMLTVAGGRWHPSTVLNILKNEKYKGDVKLQKTYSKDHLTKKKCINHGEVDSYYIEENHSPIVTKKIWEEAQQVMLQRAEAKGNATDTKGKHQNRYPLTGMLFCSKCGAPLTRRTWNSKYDCKKIVWQCSTYIKEGKKACLGTAIDDATLSRLTIKQKTVVEEVLKGGQKYYRYTSKSK